MSRPTAEERFWAKVDKHGPVPQHRPELGPCWPWTGALSQGYGHLTYRSRTRKAHQVAFELLVGSVPAGMELDHLCRNRACVSPAHLEPVTHQENLLRGGSPSAKHAAKTHCDSGHEFTPENTRIYGSGWRRCRTCHRLHQRDYKAQRRLTNPREK